ncbi:uncharacterized protein [Aristolochia californica]|uniref:uncharacterized protein n=1 Tax=Aristolochia californica TaxID=171875 RepID=UPI0035DCF7AA
MDCGMNLSNSCVLFKLFARPATNPSFSFNQKDKKSRLMSAHSRKTSQEPSTVCTQTQMQEPGPYSVEFQTMRTCKLGISRYPNFAYNAEGGRGRGIGTKNYRDKPDCIAVSFDLQTLYIPPLTSATTRFLGLPLPPFLRIDIVPELFQGTIDEKTGQVDLEFKAKFLFSIGTIYRAPPLIVKTVLTSEESKGKIKRGKGKRLDKEGNCGLIGVATLDTIDDTFMNSFLNLPTECLAAINAKITVVAG